MNHSIIELFSLIFAFMKVIAYFSNIESYKVIIKIDIIIHKVVTLTSIIIY